VRNAAVWQRQIGDEGDNLGAARREDMYALLVFLAWRAAILHSISAASRDFLCIITIHNLPPTTTSQYNSLQ
jgi:hypothetical protein